MENSKTNHSPKNIEMVLRKKELKEEYWPRLLKDKAKVHFLRTDFDKVGLVYGLLLDSILTLPFSGSMKMSRTRPQRTTT